MTVSFPAICPVQRSYTPGSYATKQFSSINGASVTRLYGSKAFNAELSLTFVLGDAALEELLQSYHSSYGGAQTLTLPSRVFDGLTSGVKDQIPPYLNWRWAEEPSIESLLPGRSRVQVRLTATLDA